MLPQFPGRYFSKADKVRAKKFVTRALVYSEHDAFLNLVMTLELMLNFAKLNPLSPDFHLMVDTSDKLDIAIRQPSGQVARFIHPFTFLKRMFYKFFFRQFRTVVVAFYEAFPADAQFSRDACRLYSPGLVHDEDFRIADRFSDRNGDRILFNDIHWMVCRKYSAFRRAVHMEQSSFSDCRKRLLDMLNRRSFAPEHDFPKRRQTGRLHINKQVEQGRRNHQNAYILPFDHTGQAGHVQHRIFRNDHKLCTV
ncbi:hypothetical protein B425_0291 [Bacillus amyloliquefaciens]|nr:hypothetical protein B425_0291 [Bacillus amyloliquefaciens]OBR26264.1 hypothetical protein SRCM101266_03560 [Bacillus amyloliquefaciens]